MTLDALVQTAKEQGASDLHLEAGLPMALRIRGSLRLVGEPVAPSLLLAMAKGLLDGEPWQEFQARQSYDLSRNIHGVRCRINVLRTARGVGLAIRLLTTFQASLKKLNLHPDIGRLVSHSHGLVLVSGPTGAGKTSTLAALLQEINTTETRHIITVESPIEYALAPRKSFIRQREVGRDTPSFYQALLDAMREDPDVLMVGEMRDPETMRLTLNASETGHLVLATMHSATSVEALQRLVSAFAPEIQANVCAQLAEVLVAVVCQRLTYRADLGVRLPECEILLGTTAVKSVIRQGAFAKLGTALDTGGQEGNWSFARYHDWLERRSDLYIPTGADAEAPVELPEAPPVAVEPRAPRATAPTPTRRAVEPRPPPAASEPGGVLVLSEEEGDPAAILSELERRKR